MRRGIKHIEFWVSDLKKSSNFYRKLFKILGWQELSESSFKLGETKIYFKEVKIVHVNTTGPRHICFHAETRKVVDEVGKFLKNQRAKIIRGPIEITEKDYSSGYYTIDFYDPDNYILEVAHS